MKLVAENEQCLDTVAEKILKFSGNCRVWLLRGEMGAGKTTFVKSVCKRLQILDMVSSPTFSIVNEYATASGDKVYHLDLYRIKNEHEAMDIGAEDYIFSTFFCFIEWPDKIPSMWPDQYLVIHITTGSDNARIFNVEKV